MDAPHQHHPGVQQPLVIFPIVLVIKKDGLQQFCMDYWDLNWNMKHNMYPLPLINKLLNWVGSSMYRSSMDLISGYWQVALHKEDKEKTTFSVGSGLYKFNVMPFGLTNVLASFQWNMEALLGGLTWSCCLIYIDNIIIYSQTFKEHLTHLQAIFNHLQQGWMYLKSSKCIFFHQELPFLRHLLMKEGLKLDPTKVTAVKDTWLPWLVQEVCCFLGLANYY